MSGLVPIQQSSEWQALEKHQADFSTRKISTLFAEQPGRFEDFSLDAAGLFLDYSKNLIDKTTIDLLIALAEKSNLSKEISAMFAGEQLNNTEQRPALHVALRSPHAESSQEQQVQQTLKQMEAFTSSVLSGEWSGYTSESITDVVNIGIGGSDLGPAMVYEALKPYHHQGIRCHFVSNVDPSHLQQTLEELNPASTLFVIASKSFTTLETSQNAEAARKWFLSTAMDQTKLSRHFIAVSANVEKAKAFGIKEDNIFPLWDWVGGRYSLWSAIGLPLALGLGMDNFRALLQGGHCMDEHFKTAPLEQNIPVVMALLNIWYFNFFQAESQVTLPYSQNLHLLPAFLQQLDMESLGKSVRKDGSTVDSPTGSIVWGSAGTNGQHSFHQLLHQGSHLIPAEFIAVARSHYTSPEALEQHQHLLANCLAQSQALMQGKSLHEVKSELGAEGINANDIEALAPHKVVAGNNPSSTLLLQQLTPDALGSLIACYEHRVFCQSVILQINAFDQWGVELGKTLSVNLNKFLANEKDPGIASLDASTQGLINRLKN
jgi:glucose-6-phosphate isomerase